MTPDLATRALELVSIPSVSHDEAAAAAYVAEIMPGEPVYADNLSTVYASRTGKPVVLFAGHLDTVPPQDNLPGRLEGGWVVGLEPAGQSRDQEHHHGAGAGEPVQHADAERLPRRA